MASRSLVIAVDVMFGLVDEYSGEPVIEEGKFVSPMRAVIYRGKMQSDENALLRFQTSRRRPEETAKGLWWPKR